MQNLQPYRAGSLFVDLWCRCSSCRRDVRLDMGRALARLGFEPMKTRKGPGCRLASFEAVCSAVCLQRREPKDRSHFVQSCPLSLFVGCGAHEELASLLEIYERVTPELRQNLPLFLDALALPRRPGLRKTVPVDEVDMTEIPEVFRRLPKVHPGSAEASLATLVRILHSYRTSQQGEALGR